MKQYEIKKYQVFLYPSAVGRGSITIEFLDSNNKYIGCVSFDEDGSEESHIREEDGAIFLYARMQDYPAIIDLLRNESPLYLVWWGDHNGGIWTSLEPAGEGEGPHLYKKR